MLRPYCLVLLLLIVAAPAFAAPAVATLTLLDAKTIAGWEAVEGSVATPNGGPPVFHVVVDWYHGEPGYPIGWPRVAYSLPADLRDWRGWEQIRYRLRATSSRNALPPSPIELVASTGSANANWSAPATGLKPGEWRDYTRDLSDLPARDQVKNVEFAIADADYHNGEVLDFTIERLELVRYTRPALIDAALVSPVVFSGEMSLPLTVKLLGVPAGQTVPVEISLSIGGRTLLTQEEQAPEGLSRLTLTSPRPFAPGRYLVAVQAAGARQLAPLTIVASPWEGAAR